MQTRDNQSPKSWLTTTLVLINLTLLLAAGVSIWRFGSLDRGLAYLDGQQLVVDAATKSFGVIPPSGEALVSFSLTNHSYTSIRVVGSDSNCSCTVPDSLPLEIPSGETRQLTISFHPTREEPNSKQSVRLFTNFRQQPTLDLTILGTVALTGDATNRAGMGRSVPQ